MSTATAPDLEGLYEHEFVTSLGLSLRCYLEHEEAEDGGRDHPSTPESMSLLYAFAGLIDISEVLSQDVIDLIEEEALGDKHTSTQESHDDARIEAHIDSMEYAA